MTAPRRVLPNQVVEITQRTIARTFRFLPQRQVSDLFLYVLGVAARRYNMRLHGLTLMATHYHLVVHDVDGRLPEFVQYLNSIVARALNAMQGESDKLWSGSGYVAVSPQSEDDLLARMVYGLANPAAAGLVDRIEDFPGLVITPNRIGVVHRIRRPKSFFRDRGPMPEFVDVCFERPDAWSHLTMRAYRTLLTKQLRMRESQHRAARRSAGTAVVGQRRLLRASVGERSTSWEAWFTLKPVIAARLKEQRVAAIRALKRFRDAYRFALEAWRDGARDTPFPAGTWWMVQFAGVPTG